MSVRIPCLVSLTLAVAFVGSVATPAATAGASSNTDPGTCVRTADRSTSVARLWDEALLDAIRRDFPAPTVHARNLFHLSAAMWDAWAAFDEQADGVFVDEHIERARPAPARNRAISYAAHRLLSHRYAGSVGAVESQAHFDAIMASLCFPIARTTVKGDSAAALGNRIAARIIRLGFDDGSLEREGYRPADYMPVNEPLIVEIPDGEDWQQEPIVMMDPDRWQPLALEVSITQNGQLQPVGPQQFVGPHWGRVDAFAQAADERGLPIDPGPPPLLRDPGTESAYKESAVHVLRLSSTLDADDGWVVDISPGAIGDSPLGTDDGTGHDLNPVTGQPYETNIVRRGDFGRAVAAYWADGPRSETPPGHWNTLANAVTDTPGFERRLGGVGEILDPLEWDVKLYLALNGAVHDAAVAAWGAKGYYDYVRPISMIRYMGNLGQSTDPEGPSYHPDGLALVDDLVEVVIAETIAPGGRHEHLADHVGAVAVRAWAGNPDDPEAEASGVDWILATEWVPFQLATFVTPAFAGYVSGHSTFSRAAAEVMTAITGSGFFPGGLGSWTVPAGSLEVEVGPVEDVELQWATYYDAADQAGISRLYGGIHVTADDFGGRIMGSLCGKAAWESANRYFDGTART